MRIFLLFFCFLTLPSCVFDTQITSSTDEVSSVQHTEEAVVESVKIRKKKKTNVLSDEEKIIQKNKASKEDLGFSDLTKVDRNKNVICRRFEGCLRFCSDIYQENNDCHQWPVSVVLRSWSDFLNQYSIHQIIDHMEWMGRHRDVMGFLYSADYNRSIFKHLVTRLSDAQCDVKKGALPLVYDQDSLYLARSHSSSQERKKMMDQFFRSDIPLFKGFLNKCLLESEKVTSKDHSFLSLPEYMLAHNNQIGFSMAHQMLARSCGDRDSCIQLAYCSVNSNRVWSYINSNRYKFGLDIEAQPTLCSYEDFHSLPYGLNNK